MQQREAPIEDAHDGRATRGKKRIAGMPASEVARKRAVRRGANIHIQDEDQAPTGKNAGDKQAETERAESKSHKRALQKAVSTR